MEALPGPSLFWYNEQAKAAVPFDRGRRASTMKEKASPTPGMRDPTKRELRIRDGKGIGLCPVLLFIRGSSDFAQALSLRTSWTVVHFGPRLLALNEI